MAPKEDDASLATYVDDGAISEPNGPLHRPIKLREHIAVPRHVVCRARVKVAAHKMGPLVLEVVLRNAYALVSSRWSDLTGCGGTGTKAFKVSLGHHFGDA
jgi:hypothetical protein